MEVDVLQIKEQDLSKIMVRHKAQYEQLVQKNKEDLGRHQSQKTEERILWSSLRLQTSEILRQYLQT